MEHKTKSVPWAEMNLKTKNQYFQALHGLYGDLPNAKDGQTAFAVEKQKYGSSRIIRTDQISDMVIEKGD